MSEKVYEKAAKEADTNIERKIEILFYFTEKGLPWAASEDGTPDRDTASGHRFIDFVPLNETQFARWSCDTSNERALLNCQSVRQDLIDRFGPFWSHGVDSLKKRPNERDRVKALLASIAIVAKRQQLAEDPTTKLEELQAEVARLTAVSVAMAAQVHKSFEEKHEARREAESLKRAFQSAKKVYSDYEAEAQAEIQRKDDLIAELRRELSEKLRLVRS